MSGYLTYKIYKAIGLIVIVAVVSFFYALFTGKSLWERRSDKPAPKDDSPAPPKH